MCGIQNVTRKHGTYYYRKLIRLGADKPFRIRFSLKTTSRRRAGLLAPALTLICERVAMNMMSKMARDGLDSAQRAEIFRRQILVERDRLEALHASLHVFPPEDHDDIGKALTLRLGASEMAAQDGAMQGKIDDFLVARVDPDNDNEDIVVLAWSDLAASIEHEGAEQAAIARLAELGGEQSALREAMARKVVNEARIVAIREFREVLANPGAAYAPVPRTEHEPVSQDVVPAPIPSAPSPAQPAVTGPYATMTAKEALEKFFEHNPRTGGKDGESRRKNGQAWTAKTRKQARVAARFLDEVMQGRPLAQITHDDLVKLNYCFERVHGATLLRSPKQQDMTILEIVDEYAALIAEDEKLAAKQRQKRGSENCAADAPAQLTRRDLGLSLVTTNRHFGFLRQLTDWFARHHPIAVLDYSAFIMKKQGNAREDRQRYTEEQGRMIFSLPPWTGTSSPKRRMQPGTCIYHDSWYWVPMIAWYTGMRLDEISSLELDEIKFECGHWQIQVKPNSLRALKTDSSKRVLPVASQLLKLGFDKYVEALRSEGEWLLFPELLPESGIGTLGRAFYKTRWTHLAKQLPFLVEGQANHSFRHTAIDSMKAAGIPSEIRADFAGHKLTSETEGRYSDAHTKLLREAAETIPKVTDHLVPNPINLLPKRLRQPRKARPKRLEPREVE
ncbi:tyrosine-type recombinase/integrase [Erythrobacter sp. 3-20A1M]|uniref:site-specific integrase n=1 Tax=Erythrobacter sp. 3-20A1M TaxID=2653850 RepID=UPI001BFC44EF|nr:tyrosine-type recombinase/integrase [Erythrobacter sp. 3-20A1M]QWC56477.1 tyrosine-type recombinase/integrase [Erythrobacter sp. 3-20A1M]